MPLKVYLGNFAKKLNSTARPDYTGWHSVEAVWKRPTEMDNPTVHCYLPDVESPKYNYMYIPSQDSYYWATGLVSVGAKRWEISGGMDLLATYKPQIMATPCYIEYGFNANSGAAGIRCMDSRQNFYMQPSTYTAKADITGASISWTSGTFVLTAVGSRGGVTAYALTAVQLHQLLNQIARDITDALETLDYTEIVRYFSANALAQGSAASAIRSCTWLPISYSRYSGTSQEIYLGDFATGVNGKVVDHNQMYIQDTTVPIPWPVADWRRNLCQILCYVPFDGTVAIPVQQCNTATALSVRWVVELVTGSTSIRINAGDYTVHTSSGNLGVPYGVGTSNVPLQNFISGATTAVGGVVQAGAGLGNALWSLVPKGLSLPDIGGYYSGAAQAVSGYGSAVQGAMQALTPVVQGSGSLGGSASVGQHSTLELTLLYYPPIGNDTFQARYGYPVFRVGTPVAGYCKTRGFSLAADARADELARVNEAMDSGVFIE